MFEAIPLILGIAGSIGKMIGRGKANKQLDELLRENPAYSENPLVRQQLGLARTLLNGRMPGAADVENNIYSNQATTISNTNKLATDPSKAAAYATAVQTGTNDAFTKLGVEEASDYQRRYGNFENATADMVHEQDKVFTDKIRQFQDKVAIKGAQQENKEANWGDLSNMGFGLANFGLAGGFSSMFGGGGGSRSAAPAYSRPPVTSWYQLQGIPPLRYP